MGSKPKHETPPEGSFSHSLRFWKWIRRIVALGSITYLMIFGLLVVFENKLVYPGSKYPRGNWQPTEFPFEEVTFQAKDGIKLVGWYLPRPDLASDLNADSQQNYGRGLRETVLLFHGNAENVAQSAARVGRRLRECLNAEVFVVDYRGFGKSGGSPSYGTVLGDAEVAFRWLSEHTGKPFDQIILAGHSIGGGPACYLAGKFGCKGLLLDRTFNSLVEAAQNQYPMFPVGFAMQNRFPSKDWIKEFKGPVFISHGDRDVLIPLRLAQDLYESSPSQHKKFKFYNNWGHWDTFPSDYWDSIHHFFADSFAEMKN